MSKKIITQRKIAHYGWSPDLPDHRDHQFAAPLAKLVSLPPKIDLRPHCPKVYDQGQIGSCTANAIAGAIEFDRLKQKLPDFVPSRLFSYYNERDMEHTVGTDSARKSATASKASTNSASARKRNGLISRRPPIRTPIFGRPAQNRRNVRQSTVTRMR
jgi:C1A family cysteine protease